VVSRQLVSDVPVGVFLSGGVDSSLLTLAATEVSGKAIDTFTIAYDEKEFDEGPFAREVAARAGSRHHEIKVGPKDLLNLIQDMPIFFDQPFADPTLLPSLILAKEARKVVTVGLSGDGGDELFFGYPYQRALQSMQRFRHTPLVLRKLVLGLASIPAHTLPTRLLQQWRKLNEILRYRNDSELLQYFIGTIGPVSLGRLEKLICGYTLSDKTQFYKMVQEISDLPWLQQVEQTFLRTFMCDTVLTKTDRTGMAYGLEGRVPFLDDEMVNFSANLPDHYKFRKGPSKYLLRKLLQTKMPGDLAFRKKRGFSIPLREWLNSDLRPLMDEYLDETRLTRDGLFDAKEVSRLVKEYRSGYANHSHLLFSFITFQLWKERYEV
jgi:asparagine synthase (glutamine-hydrolysing)